jgi:hypothetical protein
MTLSRAVIISLAGSFIVSAVLAKIFGGRILGLVFLLPLGFLWKLGRNDSKPPASPGNGAKPIEPE